ncbi:MAG: histidine phosphatase family protein [Burkholderiaceae bacterium]|jgi:probable phosphoglycerate mutase|nr:histidine phosphatase family protein [Burkholderiaceae bacterium]
MTVATEVLLIRHGKTEWNQHKRLQGHSDVPLNAEGIAQAISLAETLRRETLHAILSSDLQRARDTAEAIARWHTLPVQADPALRERCYGAFEGMDREAIKHQYPESHAAWYAGDPDHVFPPGARPAESMRTFYHRAISAILRVGEKYPGQKVVVVTHFGIIESAYRITQYLPLDVRCRLPVSNTSINRFLVYDDNIELLRWGDDAHLAGKVPPVDYPRHA